MRTSRDEKAAEEAIACLKETGLITSGGSFKGFNEPTKPEVDPLATSVEGNRLDSVWIQDNWIADSKLIINRTLPTGNYSVYADIGFGSTRKAMGCLKQPTIR